MKTTNSFEVNLHRPGYACLSRVPAILISCVFAIAMSPSAWAVPEAPDLWRDLGVSAPLLGGGSGHVSDASASDNNPAGIGLQKTYTIAGELGWIGQKSRQAEASACDSTTSEVAACFKFRQTQKITGAQDRRFTLAFAQTVASGFIFGIAGDYIQFAEQRLPPAEKAPDKNGQRLRLGLIYPLAQGAFFGLSSDGLYDSTDTPKDHGAGLSLQFGQYFLFNGDLKFDADSLREMLVGATVFPRDFLDFAVSYGYDPKGSQHRLGGGLVVKSQQARLIYSVVRSSEASSRLLHTAGISIFMAGAAGER